MTERLYYHDAYGHQFTGIVTAAWTDDEGRTCVVLDRSLFYPTSGGQMHDRGTLGAGQVVDVVDEGERVVHVVEGIDVPSAGVELAGEVDHERRAHHRQQHTGQHILSRIIEDRLQLATVSSRLGETGNTLDLEIDDLDDRVLDELEDATNAAIWGGATVQVRMVEPQELEAMSLRKVPTRDGTIRVIDIDGVDRCACGGTHVANTAEIGLVSILRKERIRGGLRLHFLCGQRAQEHRRQKAALVRRLSTQLTTGDDQLERLVASMRDDVKAAQRDAKILTRQLLEANAARWEAEAEASTIGGEPARVSVQSVGEEFAGPVGDLAGKVVAKHPDLFLAVFLTGAEKTQLLLVKGDQVAGSCGTILRRVLAELAGNGGGRDDHARGSFPGDDLAVARAALARELLAGSD